MYIELLYKNGRYSLVKECGSDPQCSSRASSLLRRTSWPRSAQVSPRRFPFLLNAFDAKKKISVPYNTFDGPGFPACHNVSRVYSPTTIDEAVAIVKDASAQGIPVRASGVGDLFLVLSMV